MNFYLVIIKTMNAITQTIYLRNPVFATEPFNIFSVNDVPPKGTYRRSSIFTHPWTGTYQSDASRIVESKRITGVFYMPSPIDLKNLSPYEDHSLRTAISYWFQFYWQEFTSVWDTRRSPLITEYHLIMKAKSVLGQQ